jgi:hypothetical protein
VKPFFCFYGGKWRAATPIHTTIVEPFAGAAGYATRYPDCNIVLVERDPIIAGLWRYLVGVKSSENTVYSVATRPSRYRSRSSVSCRLLAQ